MTSLFTRTARNRPQRPHYGLVKPLCRGYIKVTKALQT